MIPRVCVLSLLLWSVRSYDVDSYSQVAQAGAGHPEGPKVYKAMNMDLIFPKSFNSSENVISTTQTSAPQTVTASVESLSSTADEQFTAPSRLSQTSGPGVPPPESPVPANHYPATFVIPDNHAEESEESEATLPSATGRAVDYHPAYPFAQLLTQNTKGYNRPSGEPYQVRPRPPISRPNTAQRVVYPSYQASRTPSRAEIDKLSGKGQFSDRFTPGEAVASSLFKQNRDRKPSFNRPIGQSSNKVSSFVPTKDLYAFPPNVNSRYPSPLDTKQASPSDTVTSYLPPATGPLDNSKFVGPINPDLLSGNDAKDASGGGYHYDAPPSPVDLGGNPDAGNPPPPMMDDSSMMDSGPPPSDDGGMMDTGPPPSDDGGMMDEPPPDHDHHDYPHDMGHYADDKEYPTPPPGYLEEHGHDSDHDFHHHHHHSDIDFSHGPYFHDSHHDYDHHYPDVVYDDYHDHHHDHIEHHPEPMMIMTTEPPPPPPPAPEQPRVKKYSYFYIGRKLWYIPLYFTLWFTFYVLWLILKSIARHKVNLPNHYVSRRSIEDLNHREAREAIDKLTVKVMDGIEKFKLKFIG